jgi:hypothetical protein
MMLTNAEDVDPRLIGALNLCQEIAHPLRGADSVVARRIRRVDDETVDTDLHV